MIDMKTLFIKHTVNTLYLQYDEGATRGRQKPFIKNELISTDIYSVKRNIFWYVDYWFNQCVCSLTHHSWGGGRMKWIRSLSFIVGGSQLMPRCFL